jgi:hypothetical protein
VRAGAPQGTLQGTAYGGANEADDGGIEGEGHDLS